ncbi:MAG: UDP-N-acetylmuramoyl-L-alanine--D-glutamate ligase [Bacteroidales bacterium]
MKKRIVILGGGESGTGSAVLAVKQGFDTFLSDGGMLKEEYRRMLVERGISFEEGGHTPGKVLNANEVIKSPGIPDTHPLVQQLLQKGVPVISEIEFAGRYTDAVMICITGSNGKTTTTMLLYHILKKAGLNVGLAGNVGESFALQVAEQKFDCYVLEISSFQLDGMFRFRADIGILTNITPDHLDRYDYDFGKYTASKMRILQNQRPQDAFIYFADDPVIREWMAQHRVSPVCYPFSLEQQPMENGAWISDEKMNIQINQNKFDMYLEKLALQGRHNTCNSMAAGIAAVLMKVRKDSLRESLSDFQNVEHRLEFVVRVHGVEFINDSKATNVNSAWYALECQTKPVIWIAGGVDKGNDYAVLQPLVKEKVKGMVCLGKDNGRLVQTFGKEVPVMTESLSMIDAVKQAYLMANDGDVVLLSPACASFDLFENYEDRGRQFKSAVREL